MAILQSKAFTGADRLRLQSCADTDAGHIFQGNDPQGDHITSIQAALISLVPNHGISNFEIDNKLYGDTTAAAVFKFKDSAALNGTGKQILGPGQVTPDRIVGKQTIAALDAQMLKIEPPDAPPPPPPVTKLKVDVIVKFQGTLKDVLPLLATEVMPNGLLAAYNAKHQQKKDRKLVRIGTTTITIREKSTSLITDFLNRIKKAFENNDPGKVFIYGSSSGGRNALDLAVRLTAETPPIPIALVGTLDAAWFPNETNTVPNNVPEPTNTPLFNASGNIVADDRVDFFQKVGNHSKTTSNPFRPKRNLFTSSMDANEVHGNVNGFTPVDRTSAVKAANPAEDDDAHKTLTRVAQPELQGRIQAVLDTL